MEQCRTGSDGHLQSSLCPCQIDLSNIVCTVPDPESHSEWFNCLTNNVDSSPSGNYMIARRIKRSIHNYRIGNGWRLSVDESAKKYGCLPKIFCVTVERQQECTDQQPKQNWPEDFKIRRVTHLSRTGSTVGLLHDEWFLGSASE